MENKEQFERAEQFFNYIERQLIKDTAANSQEPKYKIGDKVIVCGELKTTIEKLQFSEKYQCYIYWFKNEDKTLDLEMESAIELLEEVEETKEHKLEDYAECLSRCNEDCFYHCSLAGTQAPDCLNKKEDVKEPKIIKGIKDCHGNLVDMEKLPFSYKKMQEEKNKYFRKIIDGYKSPNTTEGIKESDNKINIEYDWDFLKAQMNRMSKNKHKYPKNNWKKPMDIEQLKDALFRHVLEVMDNNFEDDGDEFGHLSAIALNAMMINYQLKK